MWNRVFINLLSTSKHAAGAPAAIKKEKEGSKLYFGVTLGRGGYGELSNLFKMFKGLTKKIFQNWLNNSTIVMAKLLFSTPKASENKTKYYIHYIITICLYRQIYKIRFLEWHSKLYTSENFCKYIYVAKCNYFYIAIIII